MLLVYVFAIFLLFSSVLFLLIKKQVCCKTVCHVTLAEASCPVLLHLMIASFSLVLDLTSCCFVQKHHVQVCSLGATGYTIKPRWVVGYTIQVCVNVLCNIQTTMHFSECITVIKKYMTLSFCFILTATQETDAQRRNNMSKTIQLVGGRTEIWTLETGL